ncbi:MAG: signal peptide peptidase SppA [Candidatus Cloacimonadales bacterium]|nr:signal peptide peptidase SppA [Candidatus Cloacimonadales bacterium]
MKSKWFALGCLASIIILIVVLFLGFRGISKLGRNFSQNTASVKVAPNSYLQLDLKGEIVTYNEFEDGFLADQSLNAHEIIQKIDQAAKDVNISGIFLEPSFISCGYADLNEIMTALERFRAQGKPVYAYLDFAFNRDYLLASAAEKIYLNPSASGGILLTGVGGNVIFYKDLLDKIGIDVTIVHAGKYKGAGENYSRNSFSEPVKENLDRALGAIYSRILETLARNRNLTADEIKYIYEKRDELFISKNKALDYKLVDDLYYRDELLDLLNLKDHLIDFEKYRVQQTVTAANKIAVVYAQGTIAPSNSITSALNLSASKINKILDELQSNRSVKSIVLRVNSPGGSALIAEIILNKIKQVRKVKPVIISMGNMAASGGYYISVNSDYIFADPFTITGSIGVVSIVPNISGLTDKIGINSERIGNGKYNNVFNLYEKPSQAEIQSLQKSVNSTYMEFKMRVSEGRSLTLNEVEEVAQGMIWESSDAKRNGLIDEVGMLSDAVLKAAELANISNYQIDYYPHKKSMLEELLKEKFNIDISAKIMEKSIPQELKFDEMIEFYKNIKTDPVQAIMPYEIQF